jgi:hypothetical protein
MSRLVHLVADYGAGDLAFAEVTQRLAEQLPDAVVDLVVVAPFDTIAAGFCVAQLALTDGPPDRVVVHDVTAPDGVQDARFCAGRTHDGVIVLGPNAGWAWSFAASEVTALCHVDVPADSSPFRSRDLLPTALIHVMNRHPHAICDGLPREEVPPVPERAVAYTDGSGSIETTITEPPGDVGVQVRVRIGDITDTAVVSDGIASPEPGRLTLAPGSSGWPTRAHGVVRFLELCVRGGSAAQRLGHPPAGTPIEVLPA